MKSDVARYYDDNTAWFLRFDRTQTRVVHRGVWAPRVTTWREAAHYVHERIAEQSPHTTRLLDLGCGVGESSFWLHARLGADTVGVSVSETQIAVAQRAAAERGHAKRCTFLARDFLNLGEVGRFDVAIALESFVHCTRSARFFEEAARVVKPGGRLFLCDDFLTKTSIPTTRARESCLERLRRGWHFYSLFERESVIAQAKRAGFTLLGTEVLTASLRLLSRPLLNVLERTGSALERLAPSSLVSNLVGGTALQQSERRGWTEYVLLTFEKSAP